MHKSSMLPSDDSVAEKGVAPSRTLSENEQQCKREAAAP